MTGEITDAQVEAIVAEVREDGVYVAPEFARTHGVTARAEARLEAQVAELDVPVRVVLVDLDLSDPRFDDATQLAAWIHDDLGGSATYVVWRYDGVETEAVGGGEEQFYAAKVARAEHPDDAAAQVTRTLELLGTGEAEEVHEQREADGAAGSDPASGWVWLGVLAAAALLGLGVLLRRKLPAWWAARRQKRAERPFELPKAVLRTVRAAEDRQMRGRADAEVLALGEALASDGSGTQAGAGPAWQAALDHYAAARSILGQSGQPADVVGALVLARRGEQARAAAVADTTAEPTPWDPEPTCWFNPLHDGPVATVVFRGGGPSGKVPACGPCGAAVREGREPGDILDFADDHRARHYYELPLGVWRETGYGSVDPDLLGALARRGSTGATT